MSCKSIHSFNKWSTPSSFISECVIHNWIAGTNGLPRLLQFNLLYSLSIRTTAVANNIRLIWFTCHSEFMYVPLNKVLLASAFCAQSSNLMLFEFVRKGTFYLRPISNSKFFKHVLLNQLEQIPTQHALKAKPRYTDLSRNSFTSPLKHHDIWTTASFDFSSKRQLLSLPHSIWQA